MPTETTVDLELASAVASRVGRLARLLIRETAEASRTQLSVLATLREGGPRRVTQLAESEHVAQPTMTVLVSRLEREGLVERRGDDEDRRAVLVAVTPAGTTVLDELIEKRARAMARRLEALDADEVDVLARALPVLDRLVAA